MDSASTFRKELIAHGWIDRGAAPVKATLIASYDEYDCGRVQCKLVAPGGFPVEFGPALSDLDPIQFRGKVGDQELWVPAILATRYSYGSDPRQHRVEIEGTAQLLVSGYLSEIDASRGKISCHLRTTPIGLLPHSLDMDTDGTIKLYSQPTIRWETHEYEAQFAPTLYRVPNSELGAYPVTTLVHTATVTVGLKCAGRTSLKQVISEDLPRLLDTPFLLLSLMSHRRVHWHEAQVLFWPRHERRGRLRATTAHRELWRGFVPESEDPSPHVLLVEPKRLLEEGLFQTLIDGHTSLPKPLQQALQRTIVHVLASYETGYFESQLSSLYSGLEVLMSGLEASDYLKAGRLLPKTDFNAVRGKIEKLIQEQVQDVAVATQIADRVCDGLERELQAAFPSGPWLLGSGLMQRIREEAATILSPLVKTAPIRNALLRGIGNLNKRDLVDRQKILLEVCSVLSFGEGSEASSPAAKLWPAGADLGAELVAINQRRNAYIHGRLVDADRQYALDLYRLQRLLELWILKLLGYPDSAINVRALTL